MKVSHLERIKAKGIDILGCRQLFGMTKQRNMDGRIVLFGGYNHQRKKHHDTLLSYDTTSKSFEMLIPEKSVGTLAFERVREATVNFKSRQEVVIYGGKIDCPLYTGKASTNMLYLFNLKTRMVKLIETYLPAISGHASLFWKEKKSLVIYGGWNSSKNECLNDVTLYSFTTKKVKHLRSKYSPTPRSLHSMDFYDRNSFIVFGGLGKNVYYNDLFLYDLKKEQWTEISKLTNASKPLKTTNNMPIGRCGAGTSFYPPKRLFFVFGGFNEEKKQIKDGLWVFTFSSSSWTNFEVKNSFPISYHRLSFIELRNEKEKNGVQETEGEEEELSTSLRFFVIGGATRKNKTLNSVHEFTLHLE